MVKSSAKTRKTKKAGSAIPAEIVVKKCVVKLNRYQTRQSATKNIVLDNSQASINKENAHLNKYTEKECIVKSKRCQTSQNTIKTDDGNSSQNCKSSGNLSNEVPMKKCIVNLKRYQTRKKAVNSEVEVSSRSRKQKDVKENNVNKSLQSSKKKDITFSDDVSNLSNNAEGLPKGQPRPNDVKNNAKKFSLSLTKGRTPKDNVKTDVNKNLKDSQKSGSISSDKTIEDKNDTLMQRNDMIDNFESNLLRSSIGATSTNSESSIKTKDIPSSNATDIKHTEDVPMRNMPQNVVNTKRNLLSLNKSRTPISQNSQKTSHNINEQTDEVPRFIRQNSSRVISNEIGKNTEKLDITKSSTKTRRVLFDDPKKQPENQKQTNYVKTRQSTNSLRKYEAPKKADVKSSNKMDSTPNCTGNTDIYEFLSQSSQESDDVSADVVQKLIKQGKVAVAKHKSIKKKDKKVKIKAANWKKIKNNLLNVPNPSKNKKVVGNTVQITNETPPENTRNVKNVAEITNDQFDYPDEPYIDQQEEQPIPSPLQPAPSSTSRNIQKSNIKTNQSFSKLAQSVMTKETVRSTSTTNNDTPRKIVTDKQKLLKIALNFVNHSTPNKSITSSSPQINKTQSPITSPWRVENHYLPQTFYFSRNSDDLPSYSSDVILMSQESKPKLSKTPARNPSPLKDISLNISNIENISPVKTIEMIEKQKSVLGNSMKMKRPLNGRSPLKAIQILDVVQLPNVKTVLNKINYDKENRKSPLKSPNRKAHLESKENTLVPEANDSNNFFGFNESGEEEVSEIKIVSTKKNLKSKLKRLKRLLPPKPTRISYGTVRSIFNENKEKQSDIREMLSSTAITDNRTKTLDFEESVDAIQEDNNEEHSTINDQSLRLFDDLEPETSFDISAKRKTYGCHRNRLLRKRRHNFILFSHDTDSEEEGQEIKTKKSRTQNNKNNKELKKFVTEFNSMCDEVEQYELVIEGDKSSKEISA